MPPINLKNATTVYTKVAASLTAVPLVAETARREGLYIYNDSTGILYIRVDGDASSTEYTIRIPSQGFYEMPANYFTDAVTGAWDVANGYAHVTEIQGS